MSKTTDYCFIRGDSTVRAMLRHLLDSQGISVKKLSEKTGVFRPKIVNFLGFSYKEARVLKKSTVSQLDVIIMFEYLGHRITLNFEEHGRDNTSGKE